MAKIIYTCPRCGHDLIDIAICAYPPIAEKWCPSCGWAHNEDDEEIIRMPYGGNRDSNVGNYIPPLRLNWGPFHDPRCASCPTNPANGGDGICFCTIGVPKIT